MKGPTLLLENEDYWRTRMGLVFAGERVVVRGKDLFRELRDMRWMELLLYTITGRRFNERQLRLFEGIWTICTSYPDPRIWNNRVAALAGTARSTGTLALSAATAVSEAGIYGGRPILRAMDFLRRSLKSAQHGHALDSVVRSELQKFRAIPGYARPLVHDDERIRPLIQLAEELDYGNGVYLKHAFKIEEILLTSGYRMKLNIAAVAAALAADQGLSSDEYFRYLLPCFTAGMIACYIDAVDHEEGVLFPVRCTRINYTGRTSRPWE